MSARGQGARSTSRRAPAFAPVALVLGVSCGVAAPPPSPPIVVNECPPDSCEAYQQQPSALGPATCEADTQQCASPLGNFDVTLLVSFPASSLTDPGTTVAIPSFLTSYLSQNECDILSCVGSASPCLANCARIPNAVAAEGQFVVSESVEGCAGRQRVTSGASLPVDVEFWPLWTQGSSTAPVQVDASRIGLPLLPVSGRSFVPTSSPVTPGGPGKAPGTIWNAVLGPGLYYEEDLVPQDTAYPPQRSVGLVSSATQVQTLITGTDECGGGAPPAAGDTTFTVTRGSGSLAGFSVYFEDATTLRRISSVATLPDAASASVTLLTIGQWGLTSSGASLPVPGGVNLVVSPPAGATIPTYVDSLLTPQLTLTPFPALPNPVTVNGTVLGPDQSIIDADLIIQSTPPSGDVGGITICVDNDCQPSAAGTVPRPLTYSTTTRAAGGTFSVALPPGTYDVFIVPAPGVAAGAGMSVGPTLGVQVGLPTIAGKTQIAPARATIRGVAQLTDGRVLVGATVEAHAAAQLAATGPPPTQWPRTVSAVTDGTGSFSLSVDPGSYDVVVRPVDGTGFPWMTASNKSVAPGQLLSFDPFLVPAPISIQMTLQDGEKGAVAGAVVRAFATPPSAVPSQLGGPPPEVELGTWLTDANGSFSMFIAPPE